jgi:hypothetical protein
VIAMAAIITFFTLSNGEGGAITPLSEDEMVVATKDIETADRSDLAIINAVTQSRNPLLMNGMRPTISPDRTQILFTRNGEGDHANQTEPWIMAVDDPGGEQKFIKDGGACKYAHGRPAWSNNGQFVAMFCESETGATIQQMFIFNMQGDLARDPIDVPGDEPTGFLTWVRNDQIIYGADSSDSTMVSQLDPEEPERFKVLWSMNADGTGFDQISKPWGPGSYDLPDWSEGGLLFQRKADPGYDSGHLDIWDMASDQPIEAHPGILSGKDLRGNLFKGAAWSPDSKSIVFWWLRHPDSEGLSVAKYDDLDRPDDWSFLISPRSDVEGGPPSGKAQPAWGTL